MSARPPERPQPPSHPPAARTGYDAVGPVNRTPSESIWALVAGVLGLIICPLVASVVAIILGLKGRREAEWNPDRGGRGLATAGLVLGIVGLAGWGIYILVRLSGAG